MRYKGGGREDGARGPGLDMLRLRRCAQRLAWLAILIGLAAARPANASNLVWVTGRVVDEQKRPVAGALVAVYDDSNKVVDYARTDRNGEYALAVPRQVLHLEQRHGKGFIAEVFSGVTRFVGGAADFVANPLRAGVNAVTAGEAATFADPLTKGEIAVGGAVANQMLFGLAPPRGRKPPVPIEERKQPGALVMKVITNGSN